jgi:hypothetical protein
MGRKGIKMILVALAEHRLDFIQGQVKMTVNGEIAEFLDQLAAHQKSPRFIGGEHHRRQMIAFGQEIPHTDFRTDRNAGVFQGTDVPIDGPQADAETFGNLPAAHDALGLQLNQNRRQTIDAVHDPDHPFFFGFTRPHNPLRPGFQILWFHHPIAGTHLSEKIVSSLLTRKELYNIKLINLSGV